MEAAQSGTVALWAAVAASAAALFYRPRATLRLAAVFAPLATVVLAVALLTHDFSREYVAKTTSRATPWPYRISAVWGGMEGSMLFYVAVLLSIGAWGVRKRGELEHRVVAAVGLAGLLAEPPTSDRLGAGAAHRGDVRSVLGIRRAM